MRKFIAAAVPVALLGAGLTLPRAAAQERPLAALLKDLKSDDAAVKLAALTALADLGPKAKDAVPDLFGLLHDKNEDVRLNAAIALGKVGKAAVGEPLQL